MRRVVQGVGRVAQEARVQQQEEARRAGGVAVVAEVLAEGQRLVQIVHVVGAQGLGHGGLGELQQRGVVLHGAVALDVLDVEPAGAQLRDAARQAHDLVADDLARLLAVGAADHLQARRARDDVHGLAALDDAYGDYGRLERVHPAGDYLLGVHDELRQGEDGVVPVLRLGAVRVLARDLDVVEVEGRGGDAVIQADGADLRPARRDVRGDDGVHMGVVHAAGPDHRARAAHGRLLLRGLEDELHRARQLVPHAAQQLRRGQQHGDVRVVPAGVHDARVLAGKGQARVLGDGQGVYVRAQGDAFARLPALYERHGARRQRPLHAVAAEALKQLHYLLRGPELVVAQLRVGVEVAPPGEHLLGYLVRFGSYVHIV